MHRLHLLRHAKAADADGIDDHERPLTRRGREEARRIGGNLAAALGPVDLVLCSTALRTRETFELALAGFAPLPPVSFEDALYVAGPRALLRRLHGLGEQVGAVLLIGHNPGLHELALALADPASPPARALFAGKFPTLARASFAVEGRWERIERSVHVVIDYATPKSVGDGA